MSGIKDLAYELSGHCNNHIARAQRMYTFTRERTYTNRGKYIFLALKLNVVMYGSTMHCTIDSSGPYANPATKLGRDRKDTSRQIICSNDSRLMV